MTTPADREFVVARRGDVRDLALRTFREGLRQLVNPETGALFSEAEVRIATQRGSRWYIEAQALDDYAQGEQRRALYLSDQVRIERAATRWLEGYHAELWAKPKLPATGGTGTVTVTAPAGTVVVGSTTVPSPAAYQATWRNKRFQVLSTVTVPVGQSSVVATMVAIDTGADTNPEAGQVLTWASRDPNMQPTSPVLTDFTGGTDAETDAAQAKRIAESIRTDEASGNDAHFRAWAREASNAVEEAFVYPTAQHAGSVLVAVTQKRSGATGPTARIPNTSTLADVIGYLTPPGSPVVPAPPHVLVTPVVSETTDVVLRLTLPRGSDSGFADPQPWPAYHATTPSITALTNQTTFTVTASGDATLPGQAALATVTGDDMPAVMVWDEARSRFELLAVTSIEDTGSNEYDVVLTSAPTATLAVGTLVCPAVLRRDIIAVAVEGYFDSRGPGDLFDLSTDPRGVRCVRYPRVTSGFPVRVGAELATVVVEALGGTAADATLASASKSTPSYPVDISGGPNMLTLGKCGVYLL